MLPHARRGGSGGGGGIGSLESHAIRDSNAADTPAKVFFHMMT